MHIQIYIYVLNTLCVILGTRATCMYTCVCPVALRGGRGKSNESPSNNYRTLWNSYRNLWYSYEPGLGLPLGDDVRALCLLGMFLPCLARISPPQPAPCRGRRRRGREGEGHGVAKRAGLVAPNAYILPYRPNDIFDIDNIMMYMYICMYMPCSYHGGQG